jgi:large subunit ribosomal protein L30
MLLGFDEIADKIVVVKQVGSEIASTKRQKDTLKGLGLRGIGAVSELKCTKAVYGMLVKVEHLIKVNVKE